MICKGATPGRRKTKKRGNGFGLRALCSLQRLAGDLTMTAVVRGGESLVVVCGDVLMREGRLIVFQRVGEMESGERKRANGGGDDGGATAEGKWRGG